MKTTIHSIIHVYPNKWLQLSPSGQPEAMIPDDPCEGGRGKLGARQDPQTGEWRYTKDVVPVRATNYIRDRIRKGEVFLADESIARSMGMQWIPPQEALAKAKAKAVAIYDAQHGEGAWVAQNEPKAPANSGTGKE